MTDGKPRRLPHAFFSTTAVILFSMKKSELLRALQTEIQKHNLSTFMDEKDKIVITGCTMCRKHFGTVEQFKRHITDDVLPPLLDRLSSEVSAS
jgi:hypothetical protein